jgi:hypothetical protein
MGIVYERPPGGIPADLPVPPQQAGLVLRRAVELLGELDMDAAELAVAGGDEVRIICLGNVHQWLLGLARRAEAGEL